MAELTEDRVREIIKEEIAKLVSEIRLRTGQRI